jgi:uncharacterized membrane protein YccC
VNLSVLTWVVPDSGSLALRRRFEEAFGRLGAGVWPILQTAVGASLAWFLASAVLGHGQPFFAAIAAVISSGVVVGQEGRRAIELVFGVACGLAVADLLVLAIGTGTVQIGIVVALAMAAAVMIGGGTLLITEAGVSALLAITLEPSTTGLSPDRFIDALIGSGVALAVRAVFPSDPRHMVERAAHLIFDDLVGALEETAAALRECDLDRAERPAEGSRDGWTHGSFQGSARRRLRYRKALAATQAGARTTRALRYGGRPVGPCGPQRQGARACRRGDGARGRARPRGALRDHPRPRACR